MLGIEALIGFLFQAIDADRHTLHTYLDPGELWPSTAWLRYQVDHLGIVRLSGAKRSGMNLQYLPLADPSLLMNPDDES